MDDVGAAGFRRALAKLKPNETPELAARFADVTAEELGWSPNDLVPIINDLSALARRAIETRKTMYLWNCI